MSPSIAELARLDAIGQADLVREECFDPMLLVEAAIERIERLNPIINAVITSLYDKALQQVEAGLPDGPFRGVPLLVKDFMCPTADDPYYEGMGALRARTWRGTRDSYVAERLRAAGFVILGKTNTPELALMGTTEPLAFGATRNPWDLSRSSGGSSGGSAAAVAAGLVPVAHATDAQGSIRVPASACGIVGLKPSRGRVSVGPGNCDLALMAVQGAVSRTVRDTAAMLDVMAGPMADDPYVAPTPRCPFMHEVAAVPGRLRIGLLTTAPGGQQTHRECATAAEGVAHVLEGLGHTVETVDPGPLDDPQCAEQRRVCGRVGTANALDTWSRALGSTLTSDDVEPTTWLAAEEGRRISAVDFASALAGLQSYGRKIAGWFAESFDVLLTPTMASPPPPLGEARSDYGPNRTSRFNAFTVPFNVSGQPAVSLPTHWTQDGLPVGVQLVGGYGCEGLLLQVAAEVERATPWHDHIPPVSA